MRKRTERALKELFDLTERILEPEITPVLKGSCRIQGPVDDLDSKNLQGTDINAKKFLFPEDRSAMRIESGTCTVCSAPCSLCMHHNSESGVSCNLSVRTEADSSSVINADVMPSYKSRVCDELQPAASEASNLLSTTSSHDSYLENAESKASMSASVGCDASDDVDMPQVSFSVEIRKCAEIDNVVYSLQSLPGGNSPENKFSSIPNHEVSTSRTKIELSSVSANVNGLCQGTRSGTDCKKPSDNCSEKCHVNDLERDDPVLDAVRGQDQLIEPQAATVGENYESDVSLDDVKVCDICGDAGREDYLAVCSKCSDGAEHTYCMREMLDKVPEVEWLCEECKIKETDCQSLNECKAVYGRLKSACLDDINQNSMSTLMPKQAHKLDARPTDLDVRASATAVEGSHISIRRPVDLLEEGKASELSGASTVTARLREIPVLSCQFSSKSQGMGKLKTARMEPSSEVQFAKGSEALSRSKTYLSSSSFKGLPPLYSPRGKFSRSVSFNNSNGNPKVKTLIENAPPKQKITREPTTNELMKEGSFKTSTKTIFKNKNSECSNTELVSKNPALQPSRIEDLRALKEVKDRNTVEKKNFAANGNTFVWPSATIATNRPFKVDAMSVQNDGIRNNVSETSFCSSKEGLDAGSNEGKKQISYSSKNIESKDADNPEGFKIAKEAVRKSFSALNGSYGKVEIVSPRSAIQPLESGHKGSVMRDSTIYTGSGLSALGGNRTFHSQRSNETERTTQEKLGGSAHRTSAEQNSRDVEKKGNKWRKVINAAMSRSGVLKGEKSDTLEELPAIGADMICEAALKHTSTAFNQRSLFVENNIGKVSSKDSSDFSTKKLAVLTVEGSDKVNGTRDTINSTELSAKTFAETLRGEAPLLNTSSGSAVPKLECIWQGSFNVIGTGSHSKMFFGIQAHLSTCASHRVFKLATKIPENVQLEEVSHISSWPLQLLRTGPQDENIALFFFAKDIESYDKSYRKLLDKMHRNDLALRGNIEGTELLIFTSNKLPVNSQRWNSMHYLWGMFRGKRRCYLPVMGDHRKSLSSNQDFSLPPIADVVSNAQSLVTTSKLKKLSDFISSKVVPAESTNGVDLPPMSSDIEDKTRKPQEVPLVQNLLNKVPAVPKVTQEQPLFSVQSSSGTKAEPLSVIIDTPNPRLPIITTKSCSEEKSNSTYQEKIVSDCTNSKAGNSPAPTFEIGAESSLRRAPPVPPVSPNCTRGADCINIEGNNEEKKASSSVAAIIDGDQRGNVLGADLLGCESTANRKREHSCSIERMSQTSGEKNIVETVLLKDRPSWLPVEDEREQKKTCYNSVSGIVDVDDYVSARLSSKVHPHPLYSSILRQQQPVESLCDETLKPQTVRNTEMCFFQIDLGPVLNTKCTKIKDIPSSKEEDRLESSSPDLELALGGKSKSTKPFAFPSLFHSVDGGKQHLPPGPSGDVDDASASLSLSL